jgi:hypothetical protein
LCPAAGWDPFGFKSETSFAVQEGFRNFKTHIADVKKEGHLHF